MTQSSDLRRTPLFDCHVDAGAKLVDFAGWEMPVQYEGVIDEHRMVRNAAGLFDVSHMGEILVRGAEAESYLQSLTPNDVSKLSTGRAHYSGLLTEQATYIDDLLVYRLDDDQFLLVINAANTEKDFEWLQSQSREGVEVMDVSDQYALLALQGPKATEILSSLTEYDLDSLKYYRFAIDTVAGMEALISRTGYTGEDGFELYVAPEFAAKIWVELLSSGKDAALQPAGLGARDTLRLEAAMALYGHEIDDTTTPLNAGLGWVVKLGKGDFVGRQRLVEQSDKGLAEKLIGFEIVGRGIARQGHSVIVGDEAVGRVTSGTWSPSFEKAIGMAYVPVSLSEIDTDLTIDVRGRPVAAKVVQLPFYKRG